MAPTSGRNGSVIILKLYKLYIFRILLVMTFHNRSRGFIDVFTNVLYTYYKLYSESFTKNSYISSKITNN